MLVVYFILYALRLSPSTVGNPTHIQALCFFGCFDVLLAWTTTILFNRDVAMAVGVGKSVVNSPLLKCAVNGNDPNVGRLISSIGKYFAQPNSDEER